jgi:phage-related baseplate assembly protein
MYDINVIDQKSFEEILAEIKSKIPEEIALLESDPAAKILEVVAFREMILRERINNAAKANLLAFAGGGDLDYEHYRFHVIQPAADIEVASDECVALNSLEFA